MKFMQRLLRYPEFWGITVLALLTRLWHLVLPPSVVFDEVYFREFASNYLNGHYFFDIHPPLVKLIFAGAASLFHISADQLGGQDTSALILRYIPALAGALLVPLMYVILRQLHLGRRVATIGAVFVLLDNALLVESRFILMDSLLLLAGMGALSAYLAMRRSRGVLRWVWTIVVGLLLGALVTTKWTGLAVAGLVAITWCIDAVLMRVNWQRLLGEVAVVLAIVSTIYIGSFMIHFSLLTRSGDGDAFMSDKFQSTLLDNAHYKDTSRMAFWDKFVELNEKMYTAQSSLEGVQHPYASKWYTWPFEIRPIYYWEGVPQKDNSQGNIYLLGNPVVWWGSTIATIAALILWLGKPKWLGRQRRVILFLLVGYALNFIPFIFIDRPMFLYHYLFALLFSIMIASVMLSLLFDWQTKKYGKRVASQTFWGVTIAVGLGFIYFLPLSYGWPLSPNDLQQHMWLSTWR